MAGPAADGVEDRRGAAADLAEVREQDGGIEVALDGHSRARGAAHAGAISTRQSSPMTSPPASRMRGSRVAVPVPKWITGTPAGRRRMAARLCGKTNSR